MKRWTLDVKLDNVMNHLKVEKMKTLLIALFSIFVIYPVLATDIDDSKKPLVWHAQKAIEAYHKDHVDRFADLIRLHKTVESGSQEIHQLLLGKKGLRRPNQPKNPERYQKQVDWALDYIIQRNFHWLKGFFIIIGGKLDQYDAEDSKKILKDALTESYEEELEFCFLKEMCQEIDNGIVLDERYTQHVGFTILTSMVSLWHFDKEMAVQRFFEGDDLYTFLKNRKNYEKAGLDAKYIDIFHQYILTRFDTAEKLEKYLKDMGYQQILNRQLEQEKLFENSKISDPIKGVNFKKLGGDYRTHFTTTYAQRGYGPTFLPIKATLHKEINPFSEDRNNLKHFKTSVTFDLKGVAGDGSCGYHIIRDAKEGINWSEQNVAEKTRQFIVHEIEKYDYKKPLLNFLIVHHIDGANDKSYHFQDPVKAYKDPALLKKHVHAYFLKGPWAGSHCLQYLSYLFNWDIIVSELTQFKGEPNPRQNSKNFFSVALHPSKRFWYFSSDFHAMYAVDPVMKIEEVQ